MDRARVVLVGNAAHASAPNMAQGAAMAVEGKRSRPRRDAHRRATPRAGAGAGYANGASRGWRSCRHRPIAAYRTEKPAHVSSATSTLRLAAERIYESNSIAPREKYRSRPRTYEVPRHTSAVPPRPMGALLLDGDRPLCRSRCADARDALAHRARPRPRPAGHGRPAGCVDWQLVVAAPFGRRGVPATRAVPWSAWAPRHRPRSARQRSTLRRHELVRSGERGQRPGSTSPPRAARCSPTRWVGKEPEMADELLGRSIPTVLENSASRERRVRRFTSGFRNPGVKPPAIGERPPLLSPERLLSPNR